ncbi:Clp protease ClpP [Pirellulaceae bacterium SH467]
MEIHINGPIEPGLAAEVKAALRSAGGRPVTIRINSEGGSVLEGLAVYDAIAAYAGKTTAIVESAALSMASAIMLAADEVRATPNALIMAHSPHMEGEDLSESDESLLEKLHRKLRDIYSLRTGLDIEDVEELMEAEAFLDAEEAMDHGFIDAIEQPTKRSFDHHVARIAARVPAFAKAVASARSKATSNAKSLKEQFEAAVESARKAGIRPGERASWIEANHPGLRQRYVAAVNAR